MRRLTKLLQEKLFFLVTAMSVFAAYYILFSGYFPNAAGGLGHDYMQQFPNLLAGYYWFQQNGIFSVPWFNPAQCGGVPFYPDAGHGLYSLPQFLVLLVNPLTAIKLTFLIFALAGFVGFYLLLRRKFEVNQYYALLGATLFLFNGFYVHRMIIGHPFHAFMLFPFLPILLLPGRAQGSDRFRKNFYYGALAGVIIAYMFHSAMMHIIPPVVLAVCVVLLIYSATHGRQKAAWFRLAVAIILAIGLSSSKLVASFSFLKQFPRDYYTLPGFPNFFDAVSVMMQSVFTRPPVEMTDRLITNAQWAIDRQELEFGVTPLPLLIILVASVRYVATKKPREMIPDKRVIAHVLAIGLLLVIPLAVNFYQPSWNAILKSIPIIKSSSLLLRWFAMYIPVSILFAVLLANSWQLTARYASWIALGALIVVIGYQAAENRAYYDAQRYDWTPIVQAYEQSRSSGAVKPIQGVATHGESPAEKSLQQNNLMVAGLSQFKCYDAVFGYRLEWLPVGDLHQGSALDIHDDHLNVKNPACYVFPQENNCQPGDHFKAVQRTEAEAFLDYKPFPFRKSLPQRVVDAFNLGFLMLVGVTVMSPIAKFVIDKLRGPSARHDEPRRVKAKSRKR